MEKCFGCGRDISTAKERMQRRLLSSSTAERVRNMLTSLFQWHGLQVNSEAIRRGYLSRNGVRSSEEDIYPGIV